MISFNIPPYYGTEEEKISEAIVDDCGTDAPGSLVAWMCKRSPMHSMVMPGKRYDIGNLESYRLIKESYKGPKKE